MNLAFADPVTHPVLIVAVAMILFVAAPLLFERARIPGIVGILIAGAVVGPHGLNLLARDGTIILLGTVGLLYIMFLAGVDLDLHGLRRRPSRSVGFGLLTNLLPQLLGLPLGLLLGYGWPASILLGSMFASHTLVAYPVASRLGIVRNDAVTAAVGGTLVTDTLALLVLAVISASVGGSLDAAFWVRLGVSLALFAAVVLLVMPRIARWFFRNERGGSPPQLTLVLAVLFVSAALAEAAGVEGILGAFLAGLALNRLIPEGGLLMNRLHFVGDALFIPFFLLSVGMLVDVRVLAADPRAWLVMVGMTTVVLVTKWMAAAAAGRLYGYDRDEVMVAFGLTIPQAAATLAATLVGYRLELFDDAVLNGSILMILVTCSLGPWTVQRYGRRLALQVDRRREAPTEGASRVLIPVANPGSAEALVALALLFRDLSSREPVHPLTVVPGVGGRVESQVAEAERLLAEVAAFAAGLDVPVVPLTRVDVSPATGIGRAVVETGSSMVVVGWDARRSTERWMFGSVLDQVLEQTRTLVVVARLTASPNATRRIVLILPPRYHLAPGMESLLRAVRTAATRLRAGLAVWCVDPDSPDPTPGWTGAPVDVRRCAGWEALRSALAQDGRPHDLVVVASARRGGVAWDRELERIPGHLAEQEDRSFLMAYPAESEVGLASLPDLLSARP